MKLGGGGGGREGEKGGKVTRNKNFLSCLIHHRPLQLVAAVVLQRIDRPSPPIIYSTPLLEIVFTKRLT